MGNTIFIDANNNTSSSLYKSLTKSSSATSGSSYIEMLKALTAETEETATTETVDKSSMTLKEYQAYISEKIQSMDKTSTLTASVKITDSGWERMKKDAEYESWVLGEIAENLSASDPWAEVGSGGYTVMNFTASEEHYKVDKWGKDFPGSIETYLTMEYFDAWDPTDSDNDSVSSTFKLYQKMFKNQLSATNQSTLSALSSAASALQSVNLLVNGTSAEGLANNRDLTSAQNALFLLQALNNNNNLY